MASAHAPQPVFYGRRKSPSFSNQIIQFPLSVIRRGPAGSFGIRISGNTMSKAGLFDGDYVILRKAEAPVDGAIMLCRYKEQPIIKRVRIEAGKAYLCWEDDSRKRLEADPASCEVLGVLEWGYKTAER